MKILITPLLLLFLMSSSAQAELNDQGLNSIISIIDKAIDTLKADKTGSKEEEKVKKGVKVEELDVSNSILVNMARTLGKLSFSRLQCGEANVLGEFTKRVQLAPEQYQNLMRIAFQEGFDRSKAETKLLSEDECKRLTESRQLKAKVVEDKVKVPIKEAAVVEEKAPEPEEDPSLKHMRLAHMAGQFAFKKKFCGDRAIINKDFNEIISNMPKEMQKEGKEAYWKGYKQGKRMNKNLTQDNC